MVRMNDRLFPPVAVHVAALKETLKHPYGTQQSQKEEAIAYFDEVVRQHIRQEDELREQQKKGGTYPKP